MGSIEDEFQKAIKYIQELPKEGPYKRTNEVKLKFYGLYKQSLEGPCTKPKPSFFDPKGRAKWKAWVALGQMSKEEAMTNYVDDYKKLRTHFESSSAAQES